MKNMSRWIRLLLMGLMVVESGVVDAKTRIKPQRLSRRKMALEQERLKQEILRRQKEMWKKVAPRLRRIWSARMKARQRRRMSARKPTSLLLGLSAKKKGAPHLKKQLPAASRKTLPTDEMMLRAFKEGKTSASIGGRTFNFAQPGNAQRAFIKELETTSLSKLFGFDVTKFNRMPKEQQRTQLIKAYNEIIARWRPDHHPQAREFAKTVTRTVYHAMVKRGWIV